MNMQHAHIGIWGYGIVGQSVLRFCRKEYPEAQLSLFDHKQLPSSTITQLINDKVTIYHPEQVTQFLHAVDVIIPSPGIDLRPYAKHRHKFVAEFDLFKEYVKIPVIGITGTVGKTTVTHLISTLLQTAGYSVVTGGNIGTGMLDLIPACQTAHYAVIELSSFQLELCQRHAPDFALITNIFPNHLDRHGTMQAYYQAKFRIIALQKNQQQALIPHQLLSVMSNLYPTARLNTFSMYQPKDIPRKLEAWYYLDQHRCIKTTEQDTHTIATAITSNTTYQDNWLIIQAAIDMLGLDQNLLTKIVTKISLPEHRLSCIATHANITFYDDSKATIPEAMLAAVHKIRGPLVLFLGGISKGVDRAPAIAMLRSYHIKHVLCFGAEADALVQLCSQAGLTASSHATLEQAFATCINIAQPGDQVLFSPAGASYDLFANYQERGKRFAELVAQHGAS